jgi:hypothetical protein
MGKLKKAASSLYLQLTAHLVIPTAAAIYKRRWEKFNNLLAPLVSSADSTFGDSNARSKSTKEKWTKFNSLLLPWCLQLTAHLVIPTPAANLPKKMGKV